MARRSHYLCLLFLVLTAISSSLTIGRIRTYASNVKASIITHASALSVTSIQTYISGVKLSFKKTNWIAVIKKVNRAADKLDALRKSIKLDISAGYGAISSPDIDPSEYDEIILEDFESRKSPVLWAHQVGRQAVQKAPDKALLGGLVLIASELFRRGVNSEKYPLPLSIREFAHTTSIELDTKLEQLSSLEWKADPFLKQEYENLQAQPLEVIDKFISSNILPSVDKDLAPLLLKSLVDRGKVKVITTSIKDLIKLSMVLLRNTATGNIPSVLPPQLAPSILDQTTSSIDMTTSTIIEQVDIVSQGIEEGTYCTYYSYK